MSALPDLETLRALYKREQETFRAQSHRLDEIQATKAEDLTPADRNAVFYWDGSNIEQCNRHLNELEDIEDPTAEQKLIRAELNKIVTLGDHIMERRVRVREELEEKLGKVDMTSAPLQPQAATTETSASAKVEVSHAAEGTQRTPTPVPSAPKPAPAPIPAPEPEPQSEPPAPEPEQEDIDPKQLYQILKVEPDASLEVIKKAIKRQRVLMHPDRNPGDASADARFADFQAACKVFDSEDTRKEFDETGKVRQIEDLSLRLRALTTGQ